MRKFQIFITVYLVLTPFAVLHSWADDPVASSAEVPVTPFLNEAMAGIACLADLELAGAQPIPAASCTTTFCSTDFDCYEACPAGAGSHCKNFRCEVAGSGGGGGSGGGNICDPSLCTDDQDCRNFCPQSPNATCGWIGVCQY